MAFDTNTVKTTDWGVMGCAAGLLIFSLFPSYVTVSFEGDDQLGGFGVDTGISAWNSYAVLGVLLLLAVGVFAAARVFANVTLPSIPVGWNLVAAGVAALGTLLLVLRAFTYPDGGFAQVDVGPGWSGWLVMLLAVGETVFAVLAFRESGETAPWQQRQSQPPASQPPAGPPPA
ncbi:MAG: hypothetical protein H0W95_03410 [Nocardioidaceae bacterium]|nr:hypothetical protein [Pseudonocardiales bacterium]MBA3719324.1 hypothetical protein [Nocardioidaceae bacterium]